MQQPWLSCAGCRAAISPKCMARLPKAFRGGGQNELWEGAIWEGRVAEITVSATLVGCLRPHISAIDRQALLHVGSGLWLLHPADETRGRKRPRAPARIGARL
eukprot:scaffold13854_cov140-Isochrysis_galbana.AAC.1